MFAEMTAAEIELLNMLELLSPQEKGGQRIHPVCPNQTVPAGGNGSHISQQTIG